MGLFENFETVKAQFLIDETDRETSLENINYPEICSGLILWLDSLDASQIKASAEDSFNVSLFFEDIQTNENLIPIFTAMAGRWQDKRYTAVFTSTINRYMIENYNFKNFELAFEYNAYDKNDLKFYILNITMCPSQTA